MRARRGCRLNRLPAFARRARRPLSREPQPKVAQSIASSIGERFAERSANRARTASAQELPRKCGSIGALAAGLGTGSGFRKPSRDVTCDTFRKFRGACAGEDISPGPPRRCGPRCRAAAARDRNRSRPAAARDPLPLETEAARDPRPLETASGAGGPMRAWPRAPRPAGGRHAPRSSRGPLAGPGPAARGRRPCRVTWRRGRRVRGPRERKWW